MSLLKNSSFKMKGYDLHVIPTTKFKTNTFVWKMSAPINEETASLRALLSQVLRNSTKTYKTTEELHTYLGELYGASLSSSLTKKGENHVITFTIEIANEKFLKNETGLLEKAFALLKEVLTNPNLEGQEFKDRIVNNEKRILKQQIQSLYDDKMHYANLRLIEEMCQGENYKISVYGDKESVEAITPKSLYDYFLQMFETDMMDLFVVGDVDVENVKKVALDSLAFSDREDSQVLSSSFEKKPEVKIYKEDDDVKQGKLNIGYRTNIGYKDKDYPALQIFNGLFGGFPHSKLFLNVREKASLAYYAASRLESFKGLLVVMSGVDSKDYDQALLIINQQLKAVQEGEITEEEIEQTKAVLNNQFLEILDNSRGIVEILYNNVFAAESSSIEERLEAIKAVTKEEIIQVANKITQDTIYFLYGSEESN